MSENSTSPEGGLDRIFIGFVYSSISAVELIFYIPCMVVMYRESEFQHTCFKLLRHQGIADIINIVQMFVLGVMLMGNVTAPLWFAKYFFGTTATITWFLYVALCHTIALNRCVVICFFQHQTTFFSERATKLWVFACWFHGCLFWAAFMTPWLDYRYYPSLFTIYYDITTRVGRIAHIISWWESAGLILLSGFWYLVIIIYLRIERNNMPSESTQAVQSVQEQERKIMKQAGVICVFAIILNQYWCISAYVPYYQYKFAIGNLLWVLNSGINPAVYLTMNKTIRNKVKAMIGITENSVHPQEVHMKATGPKPQSTRKRGVQNANDLEINSV